MTRALDLCPCLPQVSGPPLAVGQGRTSMPYRVAYSGRHQNPLNGMAANPRFQPVTGKLATYREQAPQLLSWDHFSSRGDGSRHALES
jgi:hypothetical protein